MENEVKKEIELPSCEEVRNAVTLKGVVPWILERARMHCENAFEAGEVSYETIIECLDKSKDDLINVMMTCDGNEEDC